MTIQRILFLCFVISLASCTNPTNRTGEDTATSETMETSNDIPNSELDEVKLSYGSNLMEIANSDYVIIPIGAENNKKRGKTSSYKSYGSWNGNTNFNFIFYNYKKDTSHLLLENQLGLIYSSSVPPIIDTIKQPSDNLIFYQIANRDYNLDKKLNYKDGDYLFASNRNGKNLVQLTPNNTKLNSWRIINNSNILIANVKVDENRDKKFDKEDPIRLLKIDLDKLKKGRPLLDENVEKQLKGQFYDLYLKKSE